MKRSSGESDEPKKLSKQEHDRLTRKLKRQGVLITSEQYFKRERKQFTKLILQDCRDTWATRRNLHQLLAIACEESLRAGKPLVRLRGMTITPWLPSDNPEPDKTPNATDALRLRGMGVRWD